MANRSYLVGTNSPNVSDDYDADSDVLAAATSLIPLLWLSIFDERAVQYVIVDGHRIPVLFTSIEDAKEQLKARQVAIKRALSENAKQFTE